MKNDHKDCEKQKKEILKTFENTILKVLESVEKTQNKFVEMVSKIEMEHFRQLNKHSEKQLKMLLKFIEKKEPKVEKLSRVDTQTESNSIEKEDIQEIPFEQMTSPPNLDGVKLQIEGQEEEIYPPQI